MAFDPDAYLKTPAKPAATAFDPDAYLKSSAPQPKPVDTSWLAKQEAENDKPSPIKKVLGYIVGPQIEAGTNMATSVVAKPVADVMGMAAGAYDTLSGHNEGNAQGFRDSVQRALTYEPATPAGKFIAKYNPLSLAGRGVNAAGGGVEQLIAPPGASTGRQMLGAGVHEAINQAPQFAGAGIGRMGDAAQAGLKTAARDTMQSALKPPIEAQRTGKAATAIDTLLDTKTNVSKAGVDKLQARVDDLNTQIADKIANSPAVVDKQTVANNLTKVMADFKKQVNPDADMRTVQKAYDEFLNHPELQGKASIPVKLAQEIKQGTYKSIGGKAYGELKGADLEAQKALARGLKDEIAKSVPEVRQLNAEDSKLLTTLPLVERRVLMDANKNPFGLGWLTTNPVKFAGWMADRSPGFKSIVAHMLNRASAAAPAAAAGAVPAGMATTQSANQLPPPPQ